ncbi:MAG TPA: hypothetical protein VKC64_05340 [Burkholderiales bacterium]|nr:hypothetical protein [Burkholderiales bacterium]
MKPILAVLCAAALFAAGTVAAQMTPADPQPATVVRPPVPAIADDPQTPGSPGTQSGVARVEQGALERTMNRDLTSDGLSRATPGN